MPHAQLPWARLSWSRRGRPPAPGESNPADSPWGNEKADAEAIRCFPQLKNTARPALVRIPNPSGRESCTLTPAHHLRGAVRDGKLSEKPVRFCPANLSPAAPRLVHALVSSAAHGRSGQAPWDAAGVVGAPGRRRARWPGALLPNLRQSVNPRNDPATAGQVPMGPRTRRARRPCPCYMPAAERCAPSAVTRCRQRA